MTWKYLYKRLQVHSINFYRPLLQVKSQKREEEIVRKLRFAMSKLLKNTTELELKKSDFKLRSSLFTIDLLGIREIFFASSF